MAEDNMLPRQAGQSPEATRLCGLPFPHPHGESDDAQTPSTLQGHYTELQA